MPAAFPGSIYKTEDLFMSKTYRIYRMLSNWPLGRYLFTRAVTTRAPYFRSIRPLITRLEPGDCRIVIKDRRRVRNHLNTVHAIAMCNMAELAGGLALDAAVTDDLRWIPKKMTVEYLKKAKGDLTGTSRFDTAAIAPGEIIVPVEVTDPAGDIVFRAEITMYITRRKQA